MTLAQVVAEPSQILGFTVNEWLLLLPFLLAAVVNLIQAIKGSADGKKLQAVVHAIEETTEQHPEAVKLVKAKVKSKATQLGVQSGVFGLGDQVAKHTTRLEKLKE